MVCACLRDDGLTRVCTTRVRIVLFLTDCQGAKVLTNTSGAGQVQAQEHRRAGRRACLDCQSTASCRDNCLACLADSGAVVDFGLMSSGLDRPSPACNCTGPGDYRSDRRAWPRPTGRLADGGRCREAMASLWCNGSEPPWAVTDVRPGRDCGPREAIDCSSQNTPAAPQLLYTKSTKPG